MKLEKMRKRGQSSLYSTFLWMTLFPLIILGAVIIGYNTYAFSEGMQTQMRERLKNIASAVLITYDEAYPGDYDIEMESEDKMLLKKGDTIISGRYEIMDKMKKETGVDITIFFYDLRMLTTLRDDEGRRFTGTATNIMISNKMWKEKKERFYSNVEVDGKGYYAYYGPIFNREGTCIGMIATATSSQSVKDLVFGAAFRNIVITLLTLLVTGYVIIRYSANIILDIKRIMTFMKGIKKENFSIELDSHVLIRDDEIGDMGRFMIHVRDSLQQVVELDPLTGLYNRRAGGKRLSVTKEKALQNGFDYTITLGDIDFFKRVNDEYGHEAGDVVLKKVASLLKEGLKGKGFVVRWGGEEFLAVFEKRDAQTAYVILDELIHKIRETRIEYNNQTIMITMSFGVAVCNNYDDVAFQINEADEKLYYAKEHGRNRVVLNVENAEEPEILEKIETTEVIEENEVCVNGEQDDSSESNS
ncbi:MAG: diguanylate cyclase [Clostridia bacterium]|nr:diguanylate cyclase [Clostridia bacterium]